MIVSMRIPRLLVTALMVIAAFVAATPASGHVLASAPAVDDPPRDEAEPWRWPVDGGRQVVAAFRAPAHQYGAGHRGIDLAAPADAPIHAPAEGVVAFRGTVVDRLLLTIEHANGYVSTYEPLSSALSPGQRVAAGDEIGMLSTGGHAPPGSLHLGVRQNGAYVDPMALFGGAERAVLLPCCGYAR